MALTWEGFLDDARLGNVGGTFEYFDTAAQAVIIRDTDDALISTYEEVLLGRWFDCDFANNLRIGNFGLSQFVPRHNYNGEVWAVGIIPEDVDAETGRFPTPAVDAGFYLFRYKYYEDLTPRLESFDTSEQSENQIKDAGFVVKNIGEEELNRKTSIFAPGSRIVLKLGMGDSQKMYLAMIYLDEVDWAQGSASMRIAGRNGIGYYLSEQSFDETNSFSGTRSTVTYAILEYSGADMTKVVIESDSTASAPKFDPTDKIRDGLNKIFTVWGWKMIETPGGMIVIGTPAFLETYAPVATHSFAADECFTRGINQRADGAYSRIALQSQIGATETTEAFTRTVYQNIGYFDGWNIGNRRTLYIKVLDDQSEADMTSLAAQYAKAYQYIGVNMSREIPIHPEISTGDVLELTDAGDEEYILTGIITGVSHKVDFLTGSAKTTLSVDSGGTIEEGSIIKTYTAADVTGDTRQRELIDVIRKASKKNG
jgi:hypothetical protein